MLNIIGAVFNGLFYINDDNFAEPVGFLHEGMNLQTIETGSDILDVFILVQFGEIVSTEMTPETHQWLHDWFEDNYTGDWSIVEEIGWSIEQAQQYFQQHTAVSGEYQ